MKRSVFTLLSCLAVSAASAAVPVDGDTIARTTAKPTAQFAACFAGAQTQAAQPWSFVPKENGGGTFSNVCAAGGRSPHFLQDAGLGSPRVIRPDAASGS